MTVLDDREFLLVTRQALLLMVDAIERKLGIGRTAELRRMVKDTPPDPLPSPSCKLENIDV